MTRSSSPEPTPHRSRDGRRGAAALAAVQRPAEARLWSASGESENVFAVDGELAECVPLDRRAAAARVARASIIRAAKGRWSPRAEHRKDRGGYGLLVVEGLVLRCVAIGPRAAAELLGPGDLLRPFEFDDDTTLTFQASWRALAPLRLANVDQGWMFRMIRFPEVGAELAARGVRRARRMAKLMAISHHPRLDERILLVLWELADRYGTVGRRGVQVPVPTTHELLGQLVGARRPSVSATLAGLARTGRLERDGSGWLLHGEPPAAESLRSAAP